MATTNRRTITRGDKVLRVVDGKSQRARRWPVADITPERWSAAPAYEPEWIFNRIAVRGTTTTMSGDLGAGKTLVELGLIATEGFPSGLIFGRNDLENDLDAVILPRFFELGVRYEQIAEQYRHCEWHLTSDAEVDEVIDRIKDLRLDYLSFDATQDMLAVWGVDPLDNKDAAEWFKRCPEKIVKKSGVTLLLHDHFGWMNKDHPLGATAKLMNVTTSWNLSVSKPFSRYEIGEVKMSLSQKNRTGHAPSEHVFKVGGHNDRIVFERPSQEELAEQLTTQERTMWDYLVDNGPHSLKMLRDNKERRKKLGMTAREVAATFKRLQKQDRIKEHSDGSDSRQTRWEAVQFDSAKVVRLDRVRGSE